MRQVAWVENPSRKEIETKECEDRKGRPLPESNRHGSGSEECECEEGEYGRYVMFCIGISTTVTA
jgi:hypothetical protein